jgi:hypothetical protein
MTDRMATFFICDDVLVSMTGKLTILGMYGNELIIPSEQFTLNQLVIMFQMEARINNPFKKIALKVSLPGEDRPRIIEVPQPLPTTPPFGYIANEKVKLKWPVLLSNIVLRPGAIELKVIHEEGEIDAGRAPILIEVQARVN